VAERVAIIGAGVVGCSIAYHLARDGLPPTVFEQGFPMRGTSGSTHAWVWVQSKRPDHYAELSYASRELYPGLQREVGNFEFTASGGLTPVLTDDELEEARTLIADQTAVGLSLEWIDGARLQALEPYLTRDLLGAVYSPHDANVNPLRLVPTLVRAAARRGAVFRFSCPVSLCRDGEGWALSGGGGERTLWDRVVVAAGNWSRPLLAAVGADLRVHPVRGQILVTEPVARLVMHTLSCVRQMDNGEILIGYSHEPNEADRAVTLPYLSSAAQLAVRWYPVLGGVPVLRAFAGLRVMPDDGHPILGPVPGLDGLSVAVMHSGYTLAPVVGQLASEWVRGEAPSLDLSPYRFDRFAA
jgi:glycine/D-amino acid oxidase-like deaminating enzyme